MTCQLNHVLWVDLEWMEYYLSDSISCFSNNGISFQLASITKWRTVWSLNGVSISLSDKSEEIVIVLVFYLRELISLSLRLDIAKISLIALSDNGSFNGVLVPSPWPRTLSRIGQRKDITNYFSRQWHFLHGWGVLIRAPSYLSKWTSNNVILDL